MILGGNDAVEFLGGVFIEACAEPNKRIEEAKWVDKELDKSTRPYAIVSGIDLAQDITETLNANKALPKWRGFRNILNWNDETGEHMDPWVTKNGFLD